MCTCPTIHAIKSLPEEFVSCCRYSASVMSSVAWILWLTAEVDPSPTVYGIAASEHTWKSAFRECFRLHLFYQPVPQASFIVYFRTFLDISVFV